MKVEVLADAPAVAAAGAAFVAATAREAVAERGQFTFAVSGGTTPWQMLRVLAEEDVPWDRCRILQIDERLAPRGHPDRNLTHLEKTLLASVPLAPERIHPMPVEEADGEDPERALERYASTLAAAAGSPPILDCAHLGLGADGHTASLVPGDPVLDVTDRDVALTLEYQGRRRLTVTYPLLNRARCVLWLLTGAEKADMLLRLVRRDLTIPAGRVRQEHAIILADRPAAERLGTQH